MTTTASPAAEGVVLTRLERIAVLDRREAAPGELLHELRLLLRDAEALAACRDGEEVVARRRTAPHGT